MNTLLWNIIEGVARHLVTAGATVLVAHGYIADDQTSQLVGAVMALLAIGWSAYNKSRTETRVQTALMTPVPDLPAVPSPPGTTADTLNKAEIARHGG